MKASLAWFGVACCCAVANCSSDRRAPESAANTVTREIDFGAAGPREPPPASYVGDDSAGTITNEDQTGEINFGAAAPDAGARTREVPGAPAPVGPPSPDTSSQTGERWGPDLDAVPEVPGGPSGAPGGSGGP